MRLAKQNESVRDLIDRQAKVNPQGPYLLIPESDTVVSFAQLQQQVRAVARFIENRGVAKVSSVAYAMNNGHLCVLTLLGIMYGGYRAVAINLVAGRDVIAYVLSHSQSQLVFMQPELASLIKDALQCDAFRDEATTSGQATPPVCTVLSHELVEQWLDDSVAPTQTDVQTGDDALLMYTSGTTGRPKGVTLSHGNLIAGGANVALAHALTPDDRALCVLPLYHINGLCVTLMGPLVVCGSLVLPMRFSTSAFWTHVDNYHCSWFSVVPTQISFLLRDATDGSKSRPYLRFGRSASAPLSPDVHSAFETHFDVPLIETMGLTETAAQILSNPLPPAVRKLGSPGLPVGDEVIVVNEQLQPVPAGVEGELLVRGANVMSRYFRNESATSQALTGDGWFRTGDLGRKDADGYLFISGRLKELIIKGGENIAPREIDDALYQHADVVEAAAFACPCDDFGQRVEAAVVLKDSSTLGEADLIASCVQRVGQFKSPDRIHILTELPKGPSGKIQRARIIDLVIS